MRTSDQIEHFHVNFTFYTRSVEQNLKWTRKCPFHSLRSRNTSRKLTRHHAETMVFNICYWRQDDHVMTLCQGGKVDHEMSLSMRLGHNQRLKVSLFIPNFHQIRSVKSEGKRNSLPLKVTWNRREIPLFNKTMK